MAMVDEMMADRERAEMMEKAESGEGAAFETYASFCKSNSCNRLPQRRQFVLL